MDPSDWIQTVVGIITACGVLSSIIVAIKTLKQNSEMIEGNTRPIVIIYKDIISINSPKEYIVIKNFGTSSAYISEISFDKEQFDKIDSGIKNRMNFLHNITLAPNQKYLLPISTKKCLELKQIQFIVKYCSNVKDYEEIYNINLAQDREISFDKNHLSPNDLVNELTTIDNTLQELVKRSS